MGKIIFQQNFHNYKDPIIEKDRYSLTINNPINKSTRFHNVLDVPGNPSLKRSRPLVPWRPLTGSIAQWKATSSTSALPETLNNAYNLDDYPQKNSTPAFGRDFRASGITEDKRCNKRADSGFEGLEDTAQFNDTNRHLKNEIYRPSGIKLPSKMLRVPDHRDADYSRRLKDYILNSLMPKFNQRGTLPFWHRPLAAIAAWFGYHGAGQTNSPSCAASVADILKQGILHPAFPTLSSNSPPKFTTLRNAHTRGRVMQMDSIENLAFFLNSGGVDLNIVLTINRPHSFWQRLLRLFGLVNSHTCNLITIDNDLHLVDAQKQRYHLVNMRSRNTSPMDLITALRDFIGAVAPEERSLALNDVGW